MDERELHIQECLPPDAEQPAETALLTWAGALLFLDDRLLELRDRAVPDIVPEVVFWQRYFGQIYRAIQYAMSRQAQQRRQQRPGSQSNGAGGSKSVDHGVIAAAVRRAVMVENDGGAALNTLLTQVIKQAGTVALERAVNISAVAPNHHARPEVQQQQQLEGLTVLHWAAMAGDAGQCAVLLRYGASAEARTAQHGITPLIVAATVGEPAVVELLLKSTSAEPKGQGHDQQGAADQSQAARLAVDVNATARGGVSAVQVRAVEIVMVENMKGKLIWRACACSMLSDGGLWWPRCCIRRTAGSGGRRDGRR